MVHLPDPRVPFGGVGTSGMERRHARRSFDTFSTSRGSRGSFHFDVYRRYPPCGNARKPVQRLARYLARATHRVSGTLPPEGNPGAAGAGDRI
jgi:aldehyde dehydrogenase (NAD+)